MPPTPNTGRKTIAESMAAAPPQQVFEDVEAAWLLRWGLVVFLGALACVYLTLCALFYQGQWQLVFYPSSKVDRTPASVGLPYQDVRFDVNEAGHPRLNGWWVPASAGQPGTTSTIILCHDNVGSLEGALQEVSDLHATGANVFAFDYRGFGRSDFERPGETRIYEDANAAVKYVSSLHSASAREVVLYGVGMGAAACASAAQHNPINGLVLANPLPSMEPIASRNRRSSLIPLRLLFRHRLALDPLLQAFRGPVLVLHQAQRECSSGPLPPHQAACFSSAAFGRTLQSENAPTRLFREIAAGSSPTSELQQFLRAHVAGFIAPTPLAAPREQ